MPMISPYATDVVRNTPAEITQVVRLARKYSVEAVETLFKIMTSTRSSDKARLEAANSILDRAMGRAPQLQFNVDLESQREQTLQQVAIMARQVFLEVEKGEVIDVTPEEAVESESDRTGEAVS